LDIGLPFELPVCGVEVPVVGEKERASATLVLMQHFSLGNAAPFIGHRSTLHWATQHSPFGNVALSIWQRSTFHWATLESSKDAQLHQAETRIQYGPIKTTGEI
jgi:hypothetical protein